MMRGNGNALHKILHYTKYCNVENYFMIEIILLDYIMKVNLHDGISKETLLNKSI